MELVLGGTLGGSRPTTPAAESPIHEGALFMIVVSQMFYHSVKKILHMFCS